MADFVVYNDFFKMNPTPSFFIKLNCSFLQYILHNTDFPMMCKRWLWTRFFKFPSHSKETFLVFYIYSNLMKHSNRFMLSPKYIFGFNLPKLS